MIALALVFLIGNPISIINLNNSEILVGSENNRACNDENFQNSQLVDPAQPKAIDTTNPPDNNQVKPLLPSVFNGTFQYSKGSSIIPMGTAQDETQQRMLYKQLFQRIYWESDVELIMDSFIHNSVTYPAGTLASMGGFGGGFNYTVASEPFNITKGFSLHPRKIAVFKSDVSTQDTPFHNSVFAEKTPGGPK